MSESVLRVIERLLLSRSYFDEERKGKSKLKHGMRNFRFLTIPGNRLTTSSLVFVIFHYIVLPLFFVAFFTGIMNIFFPSKSINPCGMTYSYSGYYPTGVKLTTKDDHRSTMSPVILQHPVNQAPTAFTRPSITQQLSQNPNYVSRLDKRYSFYRVYNNFPNRPSPSVSKKIGLQQRAAFTVHANEILLTKQRTTKITDSTGGSTGGSVSSVGGTAELDTNIPIPVIYVPGSQGNYKQARSLQSQLDELSYPNLWAGDGSDPSTRMKYRKWSSLSNEQPGNSLTSVQNFNVFTVDFREEASFFSYNVFMDHAEYLLDCVHTLEKLYKTKYNVEKLPLIFVGHSMGGSVALDTTISLVRHMLEKHHKFEEEKKSKEEEKEEDKQKSEKVTEMSGFKSNEASSDFKNSEPSADFISNEYFSDFKKNISSSLWSTTILLTLATPHSNLPIALDGPLQRRLHSNLKEVERLRSNLLNHSIFFLSMAGGHQDLKVAAEYTRLEHVTGIQSTSLQQGPFLKTHATTVHRLDAMYDKVPYLNTKKQETTTAERRDKTHRRKRSKKNRRTRERANQQKQQKRKGKGRLDIKSFAYTDPMYLSTDHECMAWCDQVQGKLAEAIHHACNYMKYDTGREVFSSFSSNRVMTAFTSPSLDMEMLKTNASEQLSSRTDSHSSIYRIPMTHASRRHSKDALFNAISQSTEILARRILLESKGLSLSLALVILSLSIALLHTKYYAEKVREEEENKSKKKNQNTKTDNLERQISKANNAGGHSEQQHGGCCGGNNIALYGVQRGHAAEAKKKRNWMNTSYLKFPSSLALLLFTFHVCRTSFAVFLNIFLPRAWTNYIEPFFFTSKNVVTTSNPLENYGDIQEEDDNDSFLHDTFATFLYCIVVPISFLLFPNFAFSYMFAKYIFCEFLYRLIFHVVLPFLQMLRARSFTSTVKYLLRYLMYRTTDEVLVSLLSAGTILIGTILYTGALNLSQLYAAVYLGLTLIGCISLIDSGMEANVKITFEDPHKKNDEETGAVVKEEGSTKSIIVRQTSQRGKFLLMLSFLASLLLIPTVYEMLLMLLPWTQWSTTQSSETVTLLDLQMQQRQTILQRTRRSLKQTSTLASSVTGSNDLNPTTMLGNDELLDQSTTTSLSFFVNSIVSLVTNLVSSLVSLPLITIKSVPKFTTLLTRLSEIGFLICILFVPTWNFDYLWKIDQPKEIFVPSPTKGGGGSSCCGPSSSSFNSNQSSRSKKGKSNHQCGEASKDITNNQKTNSESSKLSDNENSSAAEDDSISSSSSSSSSTDPWERQMLKEQKEDQSQLTISNSKIFGLLKRGLGYARQRSLLTQFERSLLQAKFGLLPYLQSAQMQSLHLFGGGKQNVEKNGSNQNQNNDRKHVGAGNSHRNTKKKKTRKNQRQRKRAAREAAKGKPLSRRSYIVDGDGVELVDADGLGVEYWHEEEEDNAVCCDSTLSCKSMPMFNEKEKQKVLAGQTHGSWWGLGMDPLQRDKLLKIRKERRKRREEAIRNYNAQHNSSATSSNNEGNYYNNYNSNNNNDSKNATFHYTLACILGMATVFALLGSLKISFAFPLFITLDINFGYMWMIVCAGCGVFPLASSWVQNGVLHNFFDAIIREQRRIQYEMMIRQRQQELAAAASASKKKN
eukprot:g2916.t1